MLDDRAKAYNIQRLNFLLVDDNKFMRSVVRALLNSWGCKNIAEASDGEEGLKTLKDFPADVVVTDWEMAPMNGLEFARRLRGDPNSPNRFVPVILLTAHTEAWRVKAARDAGIHEFLAKPVQPKALYERICVLIERPRKFVRAGSYFGPDRHRHKGRHFDGDDRRQDEGEAPPPPKPGGTRVFIVDLSPLFAPQIPPLACRFSSFLADLGLPGFFC